MNTKEILDEITDAAEEIIDDIVDVAEDVIETAVQASISSVMTVMGHGDYFHRVVDHVGRIEAEMPESTGKEKRAKFLAQFWIVLNDILVILVVPFGEAVMRQLLEMALAYINAGSAIKV